VLNCHPVIGRDEMNTDACKILGGSGSGRLVAMR